MNESEFIQNYLTGEITDISINMLRLLYMAYSNISKAKKNNKTRTSLIQCDYKALGFSEYDVQRFKSFFFVKGIQMFQTDNNTFYFSWNS